VLRFRSRRAWSPIASLRFRGVPDLPSLRKSPERVNEPHLFSPVATTDSLLYAPGLPATGFGIGGNGYLSAQLRTLLEGPNMATWLVILLIVLLVLLVFGGIGYGRRGV
jgi:hypothetical protein